MLDVLEFERQHYSLSTAYHRAFILGGKASYKYNDTRRELKKIHITAYCEVISYDVNTKTYKTDSFYHLNNARHGHSSIVLKNKEGEPEWLYVFGGFTEDLQKKEKEAVNIEKVNLR